MILLNLTLMLILFYTESPVVAETPSLCPVVTAMYQEQRVLTSAVLQNQEDTTKAIHQVHAQLPNTSTTLMQINESLNQIATCATYWLDNVKLLTML